MEAMATPIRSCCLLSEHYNPSRIGSSCLPNQKRFVISNNNNNNRKLKKKKNDSLLSSSKSLNSPIFTVQALQLDLDADKPEGTIGSESEVLVWPSPDDEIPFWKREFHFSDASSECPPNLQKDTDLLHIVHVTADLAPIAKVGGTGLGRACLSRGHKVDIMLPFYEFILKQNINELALITSYNLYHDGNWVPTNAYYGVVSGIPVIFIEPSNHFFKGESVYGGSYNELEAYLFFSRACLEWMLLEHSLISFTFMSGRLVCYPCFTGISTLISHFSQEQLSKCGLDGSIYGTVDKAVDDRTIGHNPERLSLLKGGFVYRNTVVTVSPTYLKETLCSGWLTSTLIRNREKYIDILNGIDTAIWSPATDAFLRAKFHAQKAEGKKICKHFVQKGLGLASEDIENGKHVADRLPLVVCITRLIAQKGLYI